jgi:hypothetical protein
MRHALALAVGLLIALVGAVPAQAHVVNDEYREDVTSCAGYDDCTPDSATVDQTQESDSSGSAGGALDSIAQCESGGDPSTNTDNGYTGKYQFKNSTWKDAGGSTASAYQASEAEQDRVAASWIAAGHREAWPNC